MSEKSAKPWTEIQLGFPFLADAPESKDQSAEVASLLPRQARTRAKEQPLATLLRDAHAALLEAPIRDVDTHLLSLFEFCEAALTRALDVAPTRTGKAPFSVEEYRSLRGIGQAQWLLADRQVRQSDKPTLKVASKRKKEGRG